MSSIEVEALKLKAIAEKRILSMNYVDGRKTLLRAQEIFPGLDNISGMLAVCDILCAADMEFPVCGIDWYWVLRLPPSADVFTIETQYKTLTALVEPIRNQFPGTESAVKFLKDAFSVLSDQTKRSAFDCKRSASRNDDGCWASVASTGSEIPNVEENDVGGNQSMPSFSIGKQIGGDDASDGSDPTCVSIDLPLKRQRDLGAGSTFLERAVDDALAYGSMTMKEKTGSQEASWMSSRKKSKGNGAETCKDDVGVGMAREVLDKNPSLSPRHVSCRRPDPDFFHFEDNRKVELFAVGQIWVAYDTENMPRCYAQIREIILPQSKLYFTWLKPEPESMDEKRWLNAGLPISCGSFSIIRNKMTLGLPTMFSHMLSSVQCVMSERLEVYPKKGDVWAIYRDCDVEWCSDPVLKDGCEYEIVEILTDYSKDEGVRVAYLTKVEGLGSIFQRYMSKGSELSFQIPATKLFVFSHNVPAFRFKGVEMDGVADGMLELDPFAVPNRLVQDFSNAISSSKNLAKHSIEGNCSSNQTNFTPDPLPHRSDSDTQCYKRQWAAEDYLEDQVWAIYDGPDDMPRSYVKVNKAIPGSKVSVTYLEPHPMHDDEIRWVEEDLPSVCGIFRVGRSTVNLEMAKFSHLIKCDRSVKRSFYKIYPRKGEIWAMYKNWHSKWSLSELSDYQCQVVEILTDFDEEAGISISLLVQVKGCMTFFQRKTFEGFDLTRTLTRRDLLSFCHRIPAYMVLGVESHGIPKSSWHLEPDALPPSLSK